MPPLVVSRAPILPRFNVTTPLKAWNVNQAAQGYLF